MTVGLGIPGQVNVPQKRDCLEHIRRAVLSQAVEYGIGDKSTLKELLDRETLFQKLDPLTEEDIKKIPEFLSKELGRKVTLTTTIEELRKAYEHREKVLDRLEGMQATYRKRVIKNLK